MTGTRFKVYYLPCSKMRITGGTARGRILKVPGNADIRPTTDRTREAIFSILQSAGVDLSRCLDLYAGTGALGIEALSRGADWVDFVDKDRRCCEVIRENLKTVGFSDKAKVYCGDVMKTLEKLDGKYDAVFLDPPYADTSIGTVIGNLCALRLIKDTSFIIASHSSRTEMNESYGNLTIFKSRIYGDTAISIYKAEVQP